MQFDKWCLEKASSDEEPYTRKLKVRMRQETLAERFFKLVLFEHMHQLEINKENKIKY